MHGLSFFFSRSASFPLLKGKVINNINISKDSCIILGLYRNGILSPL